MPAVLTTAKAVMFSRRAAKDNLKALSPLTVIHFPFYNKFIRHEQVSGR